jgi:hypothetical protein
LEASTKNWRKIASAFAQAREIYGDDSNRLKKLCDATRFSKSKASKLATIGSSERLRTHENLLSAVQSWTLLYEIATLSGTEFKKLTSSFADQYTAVDCLMPETPPIITHGMINAIKQSADGKADRSRFWVYAVIRFDKDAYRDEEFDGDHIADLDERLQKIESEIPWLKIDRTGVEDISGRQYARDLRSAEKIVTKSIYSNRIKDLFELFPREKNEPRLEWEGRALQMLVEEAWDVFHYDWKLAFRELDVDPQYDEMTVFEKTESVAAGIRAKRLEKLEGRDPFQYAKVHSATSTTDGDPNELDEAFEKMKAERPRANAKLAAALLAEPELKDAA